MGLVAFTMAFAALGAYVARDLSGGAGFLFFILAFGCIFGLNIAPDAARAARDRAAVRNGSAARDVRGADPQPPRQTQPGVVYQAAGTTALFVAVMGGIGYTTQRDLAPLARALLIPFIVVLVFGLIATLVAIPNANVIYCVAMLVIFAGFTAFDFNRLARAGNQYSPVPIAASIFLRHLQRLPVAAEPARRGGGGRR